jgi:hypothetical protein
MERCAIARVDWLTIVMSINPDGGADTWSTQATVDYRRRFWDAQELHADTPALQHRCDCFCIPLDVWRIGGKIRNRQKSGKLASDLVFVRKAVFMDLLADLYRRLLSA